MLEYAEPVTKLIDELKRLPGIGHKSAQRLAFHILRSSDDDAEALFSSALEQDLTDFPFQRARTLFSFGRWLRRRRRRTESREPLRASIALFDAVGPARMADVVGNQLRGGGGDARDDRRAWAEAAAAMRSCW